MTFKLSDRYPGRVKEPTEGYPRGAFKNRSAPNVDDGTYLEEDWKNDERAFFEALLINAGIEPNGNVDTGLNSQLYDALKTIIDSRVGALTTSLFGKAVGSSDSIAVTLPRTIELVDGLVIYVRAQYANQTAAPTLQVYGTNRKAIVKGNNQPLALGDIAGAGFIMHLAYDSAFDRWILLNPSTGVVTPDTIPVGMLAFFPRTGDIPGWLYVDSREHMRSEFAHLIEAVPDMILAGSTEETFKLKDPRGYFLRVWDGGKGVDTGRAIGSSQGDAQRPITGGWLGTEDAGNWVQGAVYSGGRFMASETHHGNTGTKMLFDSSRVTTTANENRPKNFAFALYIKI